MGRPYKITSGDHIDRDMVDSCTDAMNRFHGAYRWNPVFCWNLDIQADEDVCEWIFTITAPDGLSSKYQLAFEDEPVKQIWVWLTPLYEAWSARMEQTHPSPVPVDSLARHFGR
jgi:hypothetical protein